MAAARQIIRWLLVALFVPAALLFLLMAPATGGLTLPLAVLFAGVAVGLVQGGYTERPGAFARWLLYAGLALVAIEVGFFAVLAATNS